YVPLEKLPLRERHWYHLALTWDKPAGSLRVYVDGVLAATTTLRFKCDTPKTVLFLSNTVMAFAGLELYDATLGAEEVAASAKASIDVTSHVTKELENLYTPQPKPKVDWKPDAAWNLRYSTGLTKPGDFDGWSQQGCLEDPYRL